MKLRCPPQSIYIKWYIIQYVDFNCDVQFFFSLYVSRSFFVVAGRPEPTVTWFNGTEPIQTNGGVAMGRHVIVNRLEIPHLTREAYNSTLRCQASNTKLAPPVERTVRLDMLCKYLFIRNASVWYFLRTKSVSPSSVRVPVQSHHS